MTGDMGSGLRRGDDQGIGGLPGRNSNRGAARRRWGGLPDAGRNGDKGRVDPLSPPSPNPAAIARFRAGVEALAGAQERIGVAVSGGGDSLALLLLAHAAFPGAVRAATVDHGLRPEAAAEAAMVAQVCAARGLPHSILGPPPGGGINGGNMQEQARRLRYAALGRWARAEAIGHVAVAHHRGDVAESFLMRAARGSGVSGLAMMKADAPMPFAGTAAGEGGVRLIRPLLGWSRAELRAIVDAAGLIPADDPSNRDPRYDRTRARALLARDGWPPADRLARAAANLAEAEAALEWLADLAWRDRATESPPSAILIDMADLPRETRRRLAARAIARLRPDPGKGRSRDSDGLDRFVDRLDGGRAATLAGVRATPGARWRFTVAPARRAEKSP